MSIGNQPAFAKGGYGFKESECGVSYDASDEGHNGMTYHQWLVGQALAGHSLDESSATVAEVALQIADEMVAILEARKAHQ